MLPTKEDLHVGMQVEVNPQKDRTRKQLISGVIEELLTNSEQHPHGILVNLKGGVKGRVKKIIETSASNGTTDMENVYMPPKDISSLISGGENHFVEFKSSILWSARFAAEQIKKSKSLELMKFGQAASKFVIARSISGFLNSDGGSLVIGIKENKDGGDDLIIGIESEF